MLKKFFKRISGIEKLETIIEQQQIIIQRNDADYTNLFENCLHFNRMQAEIKGKDQIIADLNKKVDAAKEEVKKVEKALEGTIDQQYSELQKLRTQLEHATKNRKGKFYVFNPQHGMPHKIYDSYESAAKDAEKVAKISNGQKVFVLKIVSGISVEQTYEDYAIMPEEEIPF